MNLKRPLWLLLMMAAGGSLHAAEVTIYRCTDAAGRLTLRDTPCRAGQQQQTRSMLRPTDPPARRVSAPRDRAPAAPAERTRIVVMTAPRPVFECITPDGERYTSENDAGQPRWVPLWTSVYPVLPVERVHGGVYGQVRGRIGREGRYDLRLGDREPRPTPPLIPPTTPAYGYAAAGGTWVRDTCHRLPPQEACARLQDRRYELDRRYHSALQSDRVRIDTEQRGIDAQLTQDCGVN